MKDRSGLTRPLHGLFFPVGGGGACPHPPQSPPFRGDATPRGHFWPRVYVTPSSPFWWRGKNKVPGFFRDFFPPLWGVFFAPQPTLVHTISRE